MTRIFFSGCLTQLSLLCLLWASTVLANEVGSVLFAVGKVSVQREGQTLALKKGDQLQEGDLVMTGAKGRAQLKMIDKSRVALRPGTRYKVEAFVPPVAGSSGGVATTNKEEKAIINLLQGGFRTITGSVGKEKKEAYAVRTPVATIGIRGTEYIVQLCIRETADPCTSACFIPPDGHVDPGEQPWELYVGVLSGGVTLTNSADSMLVLPGEYGCVPNVSQSPVLLARPPKIIEGLSGSRRRDSNDDGDGERSRRGRDNNDESSQDESAQDESAQGESVENKPEGDGKKIAEAPADENSSNRRPRVPPQQEQVSSSETSPNLVPGEADQPERPDPVPTTVTASKLQPVTFATGPLGVSPTPPGGAAFYSAASETESNNSLQNSQQQLTQFVAPHPNANSATYAIGNASVQGAGFDPSTQLRWGRWSGGTANITLDSGQSAAQNLNNQSLHWVLSAETTGTAVLPQTGSASYSVVGNTDPTDNLGNIGVLGGANLTADFTNNVVNTDVTLSINNSVWQANGSGAVDANNALFSGNYETVLVDGSPTGDGEFSGFFLDQASGAGLSYSLTDVEGSSSVSGAVALELNVNTAQ